MRPDLAALLVAMWLIATPAAAADAGGKGAVASGWCQTSLIGTPLARPVHSTETARRLAQDIASAEATLKIAPDREESWFWLGRRLGYAGRICEAVDIFSQGLGRFPESYKLRRYRARHLARSRQFEAALTDYRDALKLMEGVPDSFEPDGLPNGIALTIGTYRTNLVYYAAQTSFATGDHRAVIDGMARALSLSPAFARDDMRVPVAYWIYLAYRKMGEDAKARAWIDTIEPDLKLIENDVYHQAVKIMQGRLKPDDVAATRDSTIKFAVAMERRFAGDEAGARALLTEIVRENPQGHWPSEVELAKPDRSPG